LHEGIDVRSERAIAIDSTRPRYYKDLGRLHVLRGDSEALAVARGLGASAARWGAGAYRSTCYPAWF